MKQTEKSSRSTRTPGRLPEAVLEAVRRAKAESKQAGHPASPAYVIEYAYPTASPDGRSSRTSLGFDYLDSSNVSPVKGQEIRRYNSTFLVEDVNTTVEVVDGVTVHFCGVDIRLA